MQILLAAVAVDTSGTYTMAYTICAVMIAVAVVLSFITKPVNAEVLEKKLVKA